MVNVMCIQDILIKSIVVVYEVFEEEKKVLMLTCYGHYDD